MVGIWLRWEKEQPLTPCILSHNSCVCLVSCGRCQNSTMADSNLIAGHPSQVNATPTCVVITISNCYIHPCSWWDCNHVWIFVGRLDFSCELRYMTFPHIRFPSSFLSVQHAMPFSHCHAATTLERYIVWLHDGKVLLPHWKDKLCGCMMEKYA